MAIAIVDSGVASESYDGAGRWTFGVSVTSGAELLIVAISFGDATAGSRDYAADSVTYNGSNMTYIVDNSGTVGTNRVFHQHLYYILSPTSGSHDVVFTYTDTDNPHADLCYYWTFTGVNTSTPVEDALIGAASSVSTSDTATSSDDDAYVVAQAIAGFNSGASPTISWASSTEDDETAEGSYFTVSSAHRALSTAGGYTIEASESSANEVAFIGTVVRPASASASVSPAAARATSGAVAPTVVKGNQSITPASADSTVSASIGTVAVASTQSPAAAQATSGASVGAVFGGSVSTAPAAAQSTTGATAPTILYGSASVTPVAAQATGAANLGVTVSGSQSVTPVAAQATTAATAPTVGTASSQSPEAAQATSGASAGSTVLGSQTVAPEAAQATSGASVVQGVIAPGSAQVTASASIGSVVQSSLSLSPATAQVTAAAAIGVVTSGFLKYNTLASRQVTFTLVSRGTSVSLDPRSSSMTVRE